MQLSEEERLQQEDTDSKSGDNLGMEPLYQRAPAEETPQREESC